MISILLLEDSPVDVDLVRLRLERAGIDARWVCVDSRVDFLAAVESHPFDVILADHTLPDYDGLTALTDVRQRGINTPFIFVSATLGEEVAVEALQNGATDYVLKQRMERLAPSILRALQESHARTAQREAEKQLRQSQQLCELIIESATDYAIFTVDAARRITSWNSGAQRLLGYLEGEILGQGAGLLFTPEDLARGALDAEIAQALREGRGGDDRWHVRKDGSRFWASGSIMPLCNGTQESPGFLKILRDRTEAKRLEESLAERDRRKDEFLAMLAHELRNPLAPLRNGIHLLRQCPDDPGLKADVIAIMERQVKHIMRLVDDLLDASRVTTGKFVLKPSAIDLAALLKRCLADRGPMIEQAGLHLTAKLPEHPIWVHGDAPRLTQVLDNLLDNAVKFSNRGGSIQVGLSFDEESSQACLSVQDTGIGIDAESLPRMFDAFIQADSSLERSRGGLGLGLALVRGIVELHGGQVIARSDGQDRGSEFEFCLPLTDPPALPITDVAPQTQLPHCRIVIIEDNRDAADTLAMWLTGQGHQIEVAYDGAVGVEICQRLHPDVVVCDIGLPGRSGLEVARAIAPEIKRQGGVLVAVSGYSHRPLTERMTAAGFDLHFVKPIDPQAMLLAIGRLLLSRIK
jgi:PAS domain S-box-containing protein